MSGLLENPFQSLLSLKARVVTFERLGTNPIGPVSIQVSPSNYSRHLSGPEEVTFEGDEFIISKADLDAAGIGRPKKGDRLNDPETGLAVISESRPMFGLGNILGYRVRTS